MVTEKYRKRKGQKRPRESEGAKQSPKRRAAGIPVPPSVREEDEDSEAPQDGRLNAIHVSANPRLSNVVNDDSAGAKEAEQSAGDGSS